MSVISRTSLCVQAPSPEPLLFGVSTRALHRSFSPPPALRLWFEPLQPVAGARFYLCKRDQKRTARSVCLFRLARRMCTLVPRISSTFWDEPLRRTVSSAQSTWDTINTEKAHGLVYFHHDLLGIFRSRGCSCNVYACSEVVSSIELLSLPTAITM